MIVSRSDLVSHVCKLKEAGHTIVTTNGCFEIVHVGHIFLINEAAKLGKLIVLLNSDKSVLAIKGSSKCIVSETDRAYVINAIRGVCYVSLFEETTPCEILEEIKPNIHVKGGDYIAEEMPEYSTVTSNGGVITIVKTLSGKSTSSIIERIKASM